MSLDALESAIDAELASLASRPIAADELARAKNGYETQFVERLERVEDRAAILNEYQLETGDPGYAQRDLDRYRKATAEDVQAVAIKVLVPNARVILRVAPKGATK